MPLAAMRHYLPYAAMRARAMLRHLLMPRRRRPYERMASAPKMP